MRVILSSILSMCVTLSAAAGEEALLVSKLGEGESMMVEYSSTGCFHSSDQIIVIKSDSATFTVVHYERNAEGKKVEKARGLLGTVKLDKEDVRRLDALFKFYADGPEGGCTTVDVIKVILLKGDKEIKKFEFRDGSCATYDMKSVITFGELEQRLKNL